MGIFKINGKFRIGNYMRDLSTVVIGVAITFIISSLISNCQEKKDLKQQLNAIYSESEYNILRLKEIYSYYELHDKLKRFLTEYAAEPQLHLKDSINKYRTAYTHTASFNYKKGAYNMFVNSGAMKLLTDRELLLNITEIYTGLEEFSLSHNKFLDTKMEIFMDLYRLNTNDALQVDIFSPHMTSTYNFHVLMDGMAPEALQLEKQIEELLSTRKY